jgi:hypothetical protein
MNKESTDLRERIGKEIDKIDDKLTKQVNWICEHLESDTDDFTGYYTRESINEDCFHIPFNEIERDLDKLPDFILSLIKQGQISILEELEQEAEDGYIETVVCVPKSTITDLLKELKDNEDANN